MPAVSGGYLGAGYRKRRKTAPRKPAPSPSVRRRAVSLPRPEVSVGPPKRTAPRAYQRPQSTVFSQPIGRVSPVGRSPAQAKAKVRRAAQKLPAEHQLPHFPTLKHYTAPQRQVIKERTVQAVRKVAAQRGIPGYQAVQKLYREGDEQTRQSLRVYGRAVRKDQQVAQARALTQIARTPAAPKLAQMTAGERRQIARTGTLKQPRSLAGRRYVAAQVGKAALRDAIAGLPPAARAAAYRQIAARPSSRARPGPGRSAGGVALAPLATVGGVLSDPNRNFLVAAAPGAGKLAGPIARDVISLARDVPLGTYYTGRALVKAGRGDASELKEMGKAFVQTDPLALAVQGRFGEAVQAFQQHPVGTALELSGAYGLGRTGGRVAGISTARTAATIPETRLATRRTYSANPLSQAVQRRLEQRRVSKAEENAAVARKLEVEGADPEVVAPYLERAGKDPRLMSTAQIERVADVREHLAQPLKRRGRSEVAKEVRPLLVSPREGGHAQRLIAEGFAPIRRKGAGETVVERPARTVQVHDLRATRKAIARQERRRVDKPFIKPHEVKDFQKGSGYSGVMWHVTTPDAAKIVERQGLDPAKAQRGTYGLGVYAASVPENIPGATASVKVAVRMRKPLILEAGKAMDVLKPFREAAIKSLRERGVMGAKIEPDDLRAVSAEMTRGLQKAGYDGVVVKGAMRGGDYVSVFHPQNVRVVADRTAAKRGGRTSAVLERNLPPETQTVPARQVKVVRRKGGEVDAGALRRDLGTYAESLKGEAQNLTGTRLRQNRRTQKRIEEVLKLPDSALRNVAEKAGQVARITNRTEQQLLGVRGLEVDEALTARVKVYAFQHMGARVGKLPGQRRERLVRERGGKLEPLSAQQVIADMRKHGVDPEDVAFVTQRPGGSGPGSFNARSMRFPPAGTTTTTRRGGAARTGAIDTHPQSLLANATRTQQLSAALKNFGEGVREAALRDKAGEVRTFRTAKEGREKLNLDEQGYRLNENGQRIPGHRWRIVRANPFGGREGQLAEVLRKGDAEGFTGRKQHPIYEGMEKALRGEDLGPGDYIAVPETYAARLAEHAEVYRSSSPTLRAINRMFSMTVLPTSIGWAVANASENTLRTLIKSPRMLENIRTFRRTLAAVERMDPNEARVIKDMIAAGHYGMHEQSKIFLSATQFSNSKMAPLANAVAKIGQTPGIREVVNGYRAYASWVFSAVNEVSEIPLRQAMAGHFIRRELIPKGMPKRSAAAVEDAARGLTNTPNQIALANDVRRAFGAYEALPPWQRKLQMQVSPFAAWSLNAVRFLGVVLPRDHPVLTGLLAAQNRITEEWRNNDGMNEWLEGHVPDFLLGSIPLSGGRHLRVGAQTPFGIATDPAQSIADLVLPQFSGTLHALQGQKWTGQPLGRDVTTDQRLMRAVTETASSMVPMFGLIQRAAEGEGSVAQRIKSTQNPLRITRPSKKGAGGLPGFTAGGGGGSAGGGLPVFRP